MGMTRGLKTTKSTQPVAENFGLWGQPALGPFGNRVVVEGAHRFDDREARMLEVGIGLYRDHERLLVFRAAARLASVAFAAQVGVVDLHETVELARFLAPHHRLHDLVLQAPCGAVARSEESTRLNSSHTVISYAVFC